ncbi:hypothetical protein ON010_g15328 [Phytophthora cinnamomi]|nr:hypothetical protein ON010_g15328 [Phytophthora cinnamomi]
MGYLLGYLREMVDMQQQFRRTVMRSATMIKNVLLLLRLDHQLDRKETERETDIADEDHDEVQVEEPVDFQRFTAEAREYRYALIDHEAAVVAYVLCIQIVPRATTLYAVTTMLPEPARESHSLQVLDVALAFAGRAKFSRPPAYLPVVFGLTVVERACHHRAQRAQRRPCALAQRQPTKPTCALQPTHLPICRQSLIRSDSDLDSGGFGGWLKMFALGEADARLRINRSTVLGFLNKIERLSGLDLDKVEWDMLSEDRFALGSNLYHTLFIHALLTFGHPQLHGQWKLLQTVPCYLGRFNGGLESVRFTSADIHRVMLRCPVPDTLEASSIERSLSQNSLMDLAVGGGNAINGLCRTMLGVAWIPVFPSSSSFSVIKKTPLPIPGLVINGADIRTSLVYFRSTTPLPSTRPTAGIIRLSDCLVRPVVPRVQAKHHGDIQNMQSRTEGVGLRAPIKYINDTIAGRSTRKVAPPRRLFECKTDDRRARLQASQARYRKKQREEQRALEQAVKQLRQEVDSLTRVRYDGRVRTPNPTLVAGIFMWLETGLRYLERASTVQRTAVNPRSFFPHTAFFTDVTAEDLYGVDAVLAQLQTWGTRVGHAVTVAEPG